MIRFQSEDVHSFLRDGEKIFPLHFKELALNQEKIPLDMDFALYRDLYRKQLLHIVTARTEKEMVGYHLAIVVTHHPHNASAGPYATTDMFYILPEHRKGGTGAKLLIAAEVALTKLGVKRMAISTKLHSSQQKLFEALGWTATDLVFHKVVS